MNTFHVAYLVHNLAEYEIWHSISQTIRNLYYYNMNVLKILPSLEILPQRDLMTMPILVIHATIASLNQDGSTQENRK